MADKRANTTPYGADESLRSARAAEASSSAMQALLSNPQFRLGLKGKDVTKPMCWHCARYIYPSTTIVEAPNQGRCSFTLMLPDRNVVLQFRPPQHRLDLDMIADARRIFGDLVPDSRFLAVIGKRDEHARNPVNCKTMIVYAHAPIIRGEPLSALQRQLYPTRPSSSSSFNAPGDPANTLRPFLPLNNPNPNNNPNNNTAPNRSKTNPRQPPHSVAPPSPFFPPTPLSHPDSPLEPLIRALATQYFLPSYRAALPPSSPDLPVRKRNVGWTLRRRLGLLSAGLPVRFQGVLSTVAAAMDEIEGGLCWGLTHGDFLLGNVVVEFVDGRGGSAGVGVGGVNGGGGRGEVRLKGLVDWAEGEWLPFGIGLYGLEEVLGRTVEGENGKKRFEYFPDADRLRAVFWGEMGAGAPELASDRVLRTRVEKARLFGLLLWHGIAFDDGALNRVVEPGKDDEELQKLDLFLFGAEGGSTSYPAAVRNLYLS